MRIGFVGLGLIGGSIAKALRRGDASLEMVAYDPNVQAVQMAVIEGVINEAAEEIGEAFSICDYVFLCAPVTENDENLRRLAAVMAKDAILTDVGSVKGDIHKHIEALGLSARFIGGHPMAGSEKTGYENAKADLFDNVYYMITPTKETTGEQLAGYEQLVKTMRALPLIVSPEIHDYATGAISHLPHVIAAALVNLVRTEDETNGIMKTIAAGGFRDITRIASSSPKMWQDICLTNTENIVQLIDHYMDALAKIRTEIAAQDADRIYQFFSESKDYRDSFYNAKTSPIRKVYACHVDIPDVTGALAKIASLLALKGISIKNIGIIHNREYEEGVLRIEFYTQTALDQAVELLKEVGHPVYEK